MSSSMYNGYPISPLTPSLDLYHYSSSLHSHSPTPFSPQRRRSSSSPPFHPLNGSNGRHNTQNERLRIPSRAAPTNECKGCMSSLFIRTLSNPTSPSMSSNDLGRSFTPIGLPPQSSGRTFPQPHFRAHSQPINNVGYVKYGYSSPDDNNDTFDASRLNDSQDLTFDLVMEPLDELGALKRVNVDLSRQCVEEPSPEKRDERVSKVPALPTTVDNANDTPLSMHSTPSISLLNPSHDLYQYSASLHPHRSKSISPKQRCSSLSPPFCQLEHFRGRQLLRSQSCVPMVGKGSPSSLSIRQHNLSRSPPPTNPSSISHQHQLDNQHEHSRTLTTHGDPAVESQVCSSPPTLDSHTRSAASKAHQSKPSAHNKQIRHRLQPWPDVPKVEDEQCPSTMIHTSDSSPFLTTSTSPPSVFWGPVPPPQIYENRLGEVFTGHVAAQN